MSTETNETMNEATPTRPISIAHLIFGLVFLGIAAVWGIGEATDADLPRTAIGFPAVLIGAGVAGLVATVVNNRRRYAASVRRQDGTADTVEPTITLSPTSQEDDR